MGGKSYVLGIDYGTDSVRALIVDADTGKTAGVAVSYYRRWRQGKFCVPEKNQFRQHPLDYIEGLVDAVQTAGKSAGIAVMKKIAGIAIDTTGSTPVAVDKSGTPLALKKEFADNPNAMFILWKDHTGVREADEINNLARTWGGIDYTKYSGGIYSSEWFWAKILHTVRTDSAVRAAAYSWVEHCDWLPALLTGNTDPIAVKRSRCAAGHKAMWHNEFGGLPSQDFLSKLDPLLDGIRARLYTETYTSDTAAGKLSAAWAKKLGLPEQIPVAVGAFDAHMGAVGGEIEPYALSKVMGTSTCDMLIAPNTEVGGKLIKGICGQVDGSIVPGMLGMEAGQSAFGDVYAWFKKLILWPTESMLGRSKALSKTAKAKLIDELSDALIAELSKAAEKIPAGETGIVALDWLNGRRTPDADQLLTGAIAGLNLGSTAPMIFRALVEATAFGAKKIVDRFEAEGVPIKSVIALGGIAKKSPFVMQTVCDVIGRPIKVAKSDQACALGAAMFAAVASGVHQNVAAAQHAMGSGFAKEYKPDSRRGEIYRTLYEKYSKLGSFVEQSR
ncbi:MAG: ribulokinase [Spirochaetes bacterium]|nr:ribulokinase [Spirochaetota bacterium]